MGINQCKALPDALLRVVADFSSDYGQKKEPDLSTGLSFSALAAAGNSDEGGATSTPQQAIY